MAKRLHNLTKWRFLPEGEELHFHNRKQRLVILEVNCPGEVCFYVLQERARIEFEPERVADEEAGRAPAPGRPIAEVAPDDGDGEGVLTFLAVCKGRDTLEFNVEGPFSLLAEGGSAYIFTADSQDIAGRIVAPVIFTRIANRRQRNPHLEMIEYQARMNIERRFAQLEAEMERRLENERQRREGERERYLPERTYRTPPGMPSKAESVEDSTGAGEARDDALADEGSPEEVRGGAKAKAKRAASAKASDV